MHGIGKDNALGFDACQNIERAGEVTASDLAARHALRIYRALGDETRLRMIRLLARRGEMGCAELAETLGLSRPTLSHHTRILQDCELIEVRREGAHRFYRLRWDVLRHYAPAAVDGLAGQDPIGD